MISQKTLEQARMDIRTVADAADVPEWARNRLWSVYRELGSTNRAYDDIGYEAGRMPEVRK